MLTVKQVATMLNVSVVTVATYCRTGVWKAINCRADGKKAMWRIEDQTIEDLTGMKVVRVDGVPRLVRP